MQRAYKDRVYWTCKSRTKGCKARLVTLGDRVMKQNHEHSCGLSTRGVSRSDLAAPIPYNTPNQNQPTTTIDIPAPTEAAAAMRSTLLGFADHQERILCDKAILEAYALPNESRATVDLDAVIRESAQVPEAPIDDLKFNSSTLYYC
ncbi:hypothetical protein Pmar_PMAR002192 [Perkinsus marinus ATCC 50983]|uniref:FLYWCH-type domain-containing protein n=1 Tax=Perkinsus marinus (strain ATCC 50983 / TXsc) TaxID=423536 RepID=C5L8W5_PERM5|nr:hypothetical protein Pmar_PMAR002192 [Perkinsus marinus ATCC 50983]EER06823.1 hypothetical protein Pmar_PMAR002192 [Perkinsus marinus ATCC 50983]|eukprot:XP_002775007.1 hypothetical protein Pmar_PMAR002192 [Perkinsus marinus ATCC 50983]